MGRPTEERSPEVLGRRLINTGASSTSTISKSQFLKTELKSYISDAITE